MELNFFLKLSVLLLITTEMSYSLDCYQCNSQTDSDCDVHPLKKYKKECQLIVPKALCLSDNTTGLSIDAECHGVRERCSGDFGNSCDNLTEAIPIESTLCRKSVTRVFGKFESTYGETKFTYQQLTPRVTRGCGYIKDKQDSHCVSKGNGGTFQISCFCEESGCNEAPTSLQRLHFLLYLLSCSPLLFFDITLSL